MDKKYDRTAEDLGNIVGLEHVNVTAPDQRIATLFYITGLGLTRDPYLVTGVTNMWVNVGRSQFHLPIGEPQVLRGRIGLVLPDLDATAKRLEGLRADLDGTHFDFAARNDYLDVTCPWGNRMRCHAPGPRFAPVALGLAYVEFEVATGAADGIARFYREVFDAIASVEKANGASAAHVCVGHRQELVFRETKEKLADYDGHHIQVYVANFSPAYDRLKERGLITQESNQYQYRFQDLFDPASGEVLFTLEHEVRSLTHPLYGRPMINRNPAITNNAYAAGHQDRAWAMPLSG